MMNAHESAWLAAQEWVALSNKIRMGEKVAPEYAIQVAASYAGALAEKNAAAYELKLLTGL